MKEKKCDLIFTKSKNVIYTIFQSQYNCLSLTHPLHKVMVEEVIATITVF